MTAFANGATAWALSAPDLWFVPQSGPAPRRFALPTPFPRYGLPISGARVAGGRTLVFVSDGALSFDRAAFAFVGLLGDDGKWTSREWGLLPYHEGFEPRAVPALSQLDGVRWAEGKPACLSTLIAHHLAATPVVSPAHLEHATLFRGISRRTPGAATLYDPEGREAARGIGDSARSKIPLTAAVGYL